MIESVQGPDAVQNIFLLWC